MIHRQDAKKIAQHGTVIAMFTLAAAFLILSIVLVVRTVTADEFAPLDNPSPQRVENPVVKQGDVLIVFAQKCNRTSEPVAIESTAVFRNIDNRDAVPFREGFGARDSGCTDLRYENPIPIDLPPGKWRVEGIDIARHGQDVQQEAWFTDEFAVEPQ